MYTAIPDVTKPLGVEAELLSFDEAVQQQLSRLRRLIDFPTWVLARAVDGQWVIVETLGAREPLRRGMSFNWRDTLCWRAFHGGAPGYCPDVSSLPAYVDAPLRERLGIGAYLGIALRRADGSLFGTLCALDERPRPATKLPEAWLQDMAVTLATLIEREFEIAGESRQASIELLREGARLPPGWIRRERWAQLLDAEESWRRLLFGPATLLALRAADPAQGANLTPLLTQLLAGKGQLTAWGDGEWRALLPECDRVEAQRLLQRMTRALGADAVVAGATSAVGEALQDTQQRAEAMLNRPSAQ